MSDRNRLAPGRGSRESPWLSLPIQTILTLLSLLMLHGALIVFSECSEEGTATFAPAKLLEHGGLPAILMVIIAGIGLLVPLFFLLCSGSWTFTPEPDQWVFSFGIFALLLGCTFTFFGLLESFSLLANDPSPGPDATIDLTLHLVPGSLFHAYVGSILCFHCLVSYQVLKNLHRTSTARESYRSPERVMLIVLVMTTFVILGRFCVHMSLVGGGHDYAVSDGMLRIRMIGASFSLFQSKWIFWPIASLALSIGVSAVTVLASLRRRRSGMPAGGASLLPLPAQVGTVLIATGLLGFVVSFRSSLMEDPDHYGVPWKDMGLEWMKTSWVLGFGFVAGLVGFSSSWVSHGLASLRSSPRTPSGRSEPFSFMKHEQILHLAIWSGVGALAVIVLLHASAAGSRNEEIAIRLPESDWSSPHSPEKGAMSVVVDRHGTIVRRLDARRDGEPLHWKDILKDLRHGTHANQRMILYLIADARASSSLIRELHARLGTDREFAIFLAATSGRECLERILFSLENSVHSSMTKDVDLFLEMNEHPEGTMALYEEANQKRCLLLASNDPARMKLAAKEAAARGHKHVALRFSDEVSIGTLVQAWEWFVDAGFHGIFFLFDSQPS